MDVFLSRYDQACRDLSVAPHSEVLNAAQRAASESRAELELTKMSLDTREAQAVAEALAHDIHIRRLSITNCSLHDRAFAHLIGFLDGRNATVTNLNFTALKLTSSLALLGRHLEGNTVLRHLTLDDNPIGLYPDAARVLFHGIFSSSLRRVNLCNTSLGADTTLATCLARNRSVHSLDLAWNNLGLVGARELLAVLSSANCTSPLKSINLKGNNVPSDTLVAIEQALERHKASASVNERLAHDRSTQQMSVKEMEGRYEERLCISQRQSETLKDRVERLERELGECREQRDAAVGERDGARDALESAQRHHRSMDERIAQVKLTCEAQVLDAQRLVAHERQVCTQLMEKQRGREEQLTRRMLEAEANYRNADVRAETAESELRGTAEQVRRVEEREGAKVKEAERLSEERAKEWAVRLQELQEAHTTELARRQREEMQRTAVVQEQLGRAEDALEHLRQIHRTELDELRRGCESRALESTQLVKTQFQHFVQELKERLSEVEMERDALRSELSGVQKEGREQRAQLVEIEQRLREETRSTVTLSEALERESAGVRGELVRAQGDVEVLREQLKAVRQAEATEKERVRELEGHVSDGKRDLTRAQAQVSALTSELCAVQTRLKSAEMELQREKERERLRLSVLEGALGQYKSELATT